VIQKEKDDANATKARKKNKKEKKVVTTPEQKVQIVFEMKDNRNPRGRGRGRERDNDNPNFNRRQWNDRGGRGSPRGGGPRKFNQRPPNFDETSFPSLTPLTGGPSEGAPQEEQQQD